MTQLTEEVLVLHLENLRLGLENTLATKADLSVVSARLAKIEGGEVPQGLKLSIIEIIRSNVQNRMTQKWVVLNSKAGVAYLAVGILGLGLSTLALLITASG